jgi:hypothetical protein
MEAFLKVFGNLCGRMLFCPIQKMNQFRRFRKKSGRDLLRLIRQDDESSLGLHRAYARRIIEKAPAAMLEPLLEAALVTACEINKLENANSESDKSFEMMSRQGLSDAAMQALRKVLEKQAKGSVAKRLVYLSSAEMRLNPSEGRVCIHWDAQMLPTSFKNRSIEYRVNGQLEHTEQFMMSVGKCRLAERDIWISPNERFDIELTLVDADGTTSLATLVQTFNRTRPGVFEFIQGSDDVFRLRKMRERVTKTKRIAYLVKAPLCVSAGSGMVLLDCYDGREDWNRASIQIYEVAPNSSGSIINTDTKEKVACWREDYLVDIDRSHVIGKAFDNRDLYGFSYNTYGTNSNLPEIIVETLDANSIRDDVEIRCECDGKRVSLPCKTYNDEVDFEYVSSGKLVIKPSEAPFINKFVQKGLITAFQKSSGNQILSYKFAVVPIGGFGIESLFWKENALWATYKFEAMSELTIPCEDGDYEMVEGDFYHFDSLLCAERKYVTVKDNCGVAFNINLNLAALDLTISGELYNKSLRRPICKIDSRHLDGLISIRSYGKRQSRAVYISMGDAPIALKKLNGATKYSFDLFSDLSRFNQDSPDQSINLKLDIVYGNQLEKSDSNLMHARLDLLRCSTGFGLGKYSIISKNKKHYLSFENPFPSDAEISFYDQYKRECFETINVEENQSFVAIPKAAVYQLDIKKAIFVKVCAVNMFGVADEDMAMEIKLTR